MLVGNNESTTTKNVGKLLSISIAMRMWWYDMGHIARWSTSRASLEASTGCRYQSSACAVSPWRPPWSTNSNKTHKNTSKTQLLAGNYGTFRALVVCENFIPQNEPSTQLIDATSCVKCEMPRLELKSSRTFLAIKCCQGTKSEKVIKRSRIS